MRLLIQILIAGLFGYLIATVGEILEWEFWFTLLVSIIAGIIIGVTLSKP